MQVGYVEIDVCRDAARRSGLSATADPCSSLHKQPFITTQFLIIIADFVSHCTPKNFLQQNINLCFRLQ